MLLSCTLFAQQNRLKPIQSIRFNADVVVKTFDIEDKRDTIEQVMMANFLKNSEIRQNRSDPEQLKAQALVYREQMIGILGSTENYRKAVIAIKQAYEQKQAAANP